MRTKPIIAGAVVVALLLLITSLFLFARQPSSTITVRYLKSVQFGNRVTATFEITNHTAVSWHVIPMAVVRMDGGVTNVCFDFVSAPQPVIVGPHAFFFPSFQMTDLPASIPLRLTFITSSELTGPKGVFMRWKLRYLWHQKMVSPNPFGKPIFGYGKAVNVLSDEFVEPEPNQLGQGNSEK